MTIYHELISLGYKDKDIRRIANQDVGTRTFSLNLSDTPSGIPLVGVEYRCDHRSEEEYGIEDLRYNALGIQKGEEIMNPNNRVNIACFSHFPSLVISTQPLASGNYSWGHDINITGGHTGTRGSKDNLGARFINTYDRHFIRELPYAQKLPSQYRLDWTTIPKLKVLANSIGLRQLPSRKAELIEYLQSSPEYTNVARNPNAWPGWFHDGRLLVLRADRGITADVLSLLYRASQRGTLALREGDSAGGSRFTLFDGIEIDRKLEVEPNSPALVGVLPTELVNTI